MSRSRKIQILTVAALALAAVVAVGRKPAARRSSRPTSQTAAEDVIYSMLLASRTGDVKGYLATYGGQMRTGLEQSVRETGEERFSHYLKEAFAPIKGAGVSDLKETGLSEMEVRVEYVYQDRTEARKVTLEKNGREWKITRIDGSERLKTPIPYGTAVK